MYQEIMLKPLWIQLCLQFPELSEDHMVKSNLGLKFNSDNIFEEAKQMDIAEKRATMIQTMQGITIPEMDDTGMMNEVPYFNAKFLIQKYMKLTPSDVRTNEKMQKKKAEQDAQKAKDAEESGTSF